MSQKTPRNFFKPLAIGAPEPMRDLPVKLERMIHFVPPHLDKVRAKVPDMAPGVDVILANLKTQSRRRQGCRPRRRHRNGLAKLVGKGTGFWSRDEPAELALVPR
jgi:malyl-CoA/(S)-citramalyl-CoA lyase